MAVKKLSIKSKKGNGSNKKPKKKAKKIYRRFDYTEDALKECLEKIRSKDMSVCKAAQQYQIPKSTLLKKLANNENTMGKLGPPTVLPEEEETMVVTWIMEKARVGYPMHPRVVKKAIQNVLKKAPRLNPFKNNFARCKVV